jgi:integrase
MKSRADRGRWCRPRLAADGLKGGREDVVSEGLGHAFIGITLDTYSHVMPGMQEEAAVLIADLVSAAD